MRKIFILFIACSGIIQCNKPINKKISEIVKVNDVNIEINIDTFSFKSDLDIEKVLFYKEKYYSVFSKNNRSFTKKMFVLNENGNFEKEVDLFQEIQRWRRYKITNNDDKVYFIEGYSEEGFKMNKQELTFEKVSFKTFPLFEDKKYEVLASCFGEWGGVAFFKNKESGNIYETSSTCPIIVNKIKGEYFITNYMGHMSGFSSVIKISNPEELKIIKNKEDYLSRNIVNNIKENSYKGVSVLLDTMGFKIAESFVVREKLKHIYSDKKGTYIGVIDNGKMKEEYKFDFNFLPKFNHNTSDGKHILTFISEDENNGILIIDDNLLNFHFIKKE